MTGQAVTPATGSMPRWQRSAVTMAVIIAGLFVIEAVDAATNYRLDQYGIRPRSLDGLTGIVWAPFLHADFAHLIANVIPGAVLGFLLLMAGRFVSVTVVVWVVSGLGVWLLSPSNSVTVGASGIVFGWLTYLLVRGIFNREFWQVLGGLLLLAVYGSILWGMLPQGGAISWQGHLFGALGGVLAAWLLAGRDRRGGRAEQTPLQV